MTSRRRDLIREMKNCHRSTGGSSSAIHLAEYLREKNTERGWSSAARKGRDRCAETWYQAVSSRAPDLFGRPGNDRPVTGCAASRGWGGGAWQISYDRDLGGGRQGFRPVSVSDTATATTTATTATGPLTRPVPGA